MYHTRRTLILAISVDVRVRWKLFPAALASVPLAVELNVDGLPQRFVVELPIGLASATKVGAVGPAPRAVVNLTFRL